jgi:hypothetical protein
MNGLVDHLLVGIVLIAGFGYAFYALGPRSLRGRMLLALSRILAMLPAFAGLRGMAQRLATKANQGQAACGGCDSCGSAQAPTQSSTEVKIPVSAISRRE